jgi:hypothetical protein
MQQHPASRKSGGPVVADAACTVALRAIGTTVKISGLYACTPANLQERVARLT